MAGESSGKRNSSNNTQLLEELEALSQSLYQSHTSSAPTTRRTASLVLPRNSVPSVVSNDAVADARSSSRPRRRMSLSPWRSRPKLDVDEEEETSNRREQAKKFEEKVVARSKSSVSEEKKRGGIWNWKPIRALSHIGMQKLSCLFSVEVVTAQNLPSTMNGLRLSVCVRKKETKDGAVQTMPSRVSQGAADFEETLFIRCHVYCSHGSGKHNSSQQLKLEPRPFLIYLYAVDAQELDFGKNPVDLSRLIDESIEKNREGERVRNWDMSFGLFGKAKGGELVLKLGFQIMEKDGGIGIYNTNQSKKNLTSPNFARKQSKSSFSMPSPKLSSRKEAWTPSQTGISSADHDFRGIDELNLDEPEKPERKEPEPKVVEEVDFPDFEVVDKGVEFQEKENNNNGGEEEEEEEESKSIVKEIVHDQVHVARLTELDSIAQQIKALESMMGDEKVLARKLDDETETGSQRLDADEETVTMEFLQMLEDEEMINEYRRKLGRGNGSDVIPNVPTLNLEGTFQEHGADQDDQSKTYLPDLGKNLGCVVHTRDGGYLAAMNPLDTETSRKETPKLAMQISRPYVFPPNFESLSGFELFQTMASSGVDEVKSVINKTIMSIDDLMGKTAEQVAFEGIASAIIQGRNKSEVASSSAGKAIVAAKAMATAMSSGRKERVLTGIWNLSDKPVTVEEILTFSMQKIEAMAVEALKIQADMAEEEAPFDVSPINNTNPLALSVPLEEWIAKNNSTNTSSLVIMAVGIQLRDPMRGYEAVGGPMIAIIYADSCDEDEANDEKRYKVKSLHVGGVKVGKRNVRDSERRRLTAMQWLVAYGLAGKAVKKAKQVVPSKVQDLLWSFSSRVMADMWLKSMRNPDVKFTK